MINFVKILLIFLRSFKSLWVHLVLVQLYFGMVRTLASILKFHNIFHVPDLSYNLCSVGQLAELGYRLISHEDIQGIFSPFLSRI